MLTPKIPCVFLPNFAVFDIVGKINFSKNNSMKKILSNCRILKFLVVNQPPKIAAPHSMKARK
jgi:hypothetical protein